VRVSVTHLLRLGTAFITTFALIFSGAALAAGGRASHHKKKPKPPTHAQIDKALRTSKYLWATINICDTTAHPNGIGIRASMPGIGVKGQMYVRIRVSYYLADTKTWHWVPDGGGDTGFVKVGSAKFKARQTGDTWTFAPPPNGSWTMRGVVDYEWKIGGKVHFRARQNTKHGHPEAALGDPPGTSLGLCEIR
jgi:hypothetical protein